MLLGDVAAASADVTATSSRLAKVARIADLLGSTTDARLVMIAVSWLSGELPQRQIGVGWAALRTLPTPAQATLADGGRRRRHVHRDRRRRRQGLAGAARGPARPAVRRGHRHRAAFPAPAAQRRTAPRRVGRGDGRRRRQGGRHPRRRGAPRRHARRRPARGCGGDVDRRGASPRRVHPAGRAAGRPDARPDRDGCGRRTRTPRRRSGFRGQARRRARADPPLRRRGRGLHPQPRRRHRPAARSGRGRTRAARHRPHRRRRGHRPSPRRAPAPIPGHRLPIRAKRRHRRRPSCATTFGVLLRLSAPRRRRPARRAHPPAGGRPRRHRAGRATASTGCTPPMPLQPRSFWTAHWPPATRA